MDAAAATLWLEPGTPDAPASLLAAGLLRYTAAPQQLPRCVSLPWDEPGPNGASSRPRGGESNLNAPLGTVAARSLARRILATDTLAFVGNSRWEINNGWAPVASRRDSPHPFSRASRRLSRLATAPELTELGDRKSPLEFLASTARFLAYLAERDAFVRLCAAHIHRLRRLARSGATNESEAIRENLRLAYELAGFFADSLNQAREDARQMWIASRPADTFAPSPNARLLAADEAQLLALRSWFENCREQLAHVFRASPVCGRWTLRFTLHHFAPAHQKVVIEQQSPDGTWRELHSRVLIEFRGQSAQVNTPKLRFEFACPVENPDAPLRIASRCLGEFAVSHVELTDGVSTRRHRPLQARHRLGTPAPASGWPKIDWLTNTGEILLQFG
jgi:hypothetical protein